MHIRPRKRVRREAASVPVCHHQPIQPDTVELDEHDATREITPPFRR